MAVEAVADRHAPGVERSGSALASDSVSERGTVPSAGVTEANAAAPIIEPVPSDEQPMLDDDQSPEVPQPRDVVNSDEHGAAQPHTDTGESIGRRPGVGSMRPSAQHSGSSGMHGSTTPGVEAAKRSRLGRELAALTAARAELNRGHAAQALRLLEAYTAEFPDGALVPEAQGLKERARELTRSSNQR